MYYTKYKISNTVLRRCRLNRDLGIVFVPDLSFIDHIDDVVRDAFKLYSLTVISNITAFQNISVLKCLYCSFVRSKLDYRV